MNISLVRMIFVKQVSPEINKKILTGERVLFLTKLQSCDFCYMHFKLGNKSISISLTLLQFKIFIENFTPIPELK